MIFLIEYNRPKGAIVRFEQFDDLHRTQAESRRLEIELDLGSKKIEHEVVLLEAVSEDALRITHRRYFEGVDKIGKTIGENAD